MSLSDIRAAYRLDLLGAFRLVAADGARIDIPSRRGMALVAMLATANQGERTRAWLEEKLWGSRAPDQARGSLRRELSNLRALLNAGEAPLLLSDHDRVRLDLGRVRVDLREFEAAGGPDRAFGLTPGEFLEGLDIGGESGFEEWLREQRNACQDRLRLSYVQTAAAERGSRHATFGDGAPVEGSWLRTAGPRALAVLPFDNLSEDPGLAYFCDGVSEEIQRTVAQSSDLKVLARSSSFQFRGADKAVDRVAAVLGVSHLLDGTVRRSGARVRISAELVECASGASVWADRFDGDLSDIFALQDCIAAAVAQALKARLAAPAQPTVLAPTVYETFLRARGVLAEGSPLFDDCAAEATPLLEAVVGEAPRYAAGWELLALARAWRLRSGHWQGSFAEGRAAAAEAAETALSLDPRRGGAFSALALLEPWGAYAARERLLTRALETAPRDPNALSEMCHFCWTVGRFREALAMAEQACELNPRMPAARLQVAQMRTYVGDYEASIRMLSELHRLWPEDAGILLALTNFAATLGFWDAYDAAVGAIDHFTGWQARDLKATRLYAETLRSKDPAARAERLRRYTELLDNTGVLALNLVEAISQMGMVDDAFALAERASFAHIFDAEGAPPSGYFPGTVLGRWSELNKTPRFIDLCDRLGLCQYWARSQRWPDLADWTDYDFRAEVGRRAAGSPAP